MNCYFGVDCKSVDDAAVGIIQYSSPATPTDDVFMSCISLEIQQTSLPSTPPKSSQIIPHQYSDSQTGVNFMDCGEGVVVLDGKSLCKQSRREYLFLVWNFHYLKYDELTDRRVINSFIIIFIINLLHLSVLKVLINRMFGSTQTDAALIRRIHIQPCCR